jgi:type I restriction enzyme M protein
MENRFCRLADLRNEADVEQSFVRRVLEFLGYADAEIIPKESLRNLTVGGLRGMPQALYRPDFALSVSGNIRWIVEAKDTGEDLDRHVWQPRAYCVLLNGEEADESPVLYYMLTNARETRIYRPNVNRAAISLRFTDWVDGNAKFQRLREQLSRDVIAQAQGETANATLRLVRPGLGDVNAAFSWCHQHIYRKDDISQSDAFSEFVKLISLKLMSDREIRDRHPEILQQDSIELPSNEVEFSTKWIKDNERNFPNPVSDIQFRRFMERMERDIGLGRRKRIFAPNDRINLKPETIKGVVKKLEGLFLFGIDADLNGRLFETFLNATMRGKDLGQFFTPRSLVKLGVKLAQLRVDVPVNGRRHTDLVLDACCGTGGFLIDVLAEMWGMIERRTDLSEAEKKRLKECVANEAIVGVDIANAPILARIARLNMYLHGDGGTRIYHLNALDKELPDRETDAADTLNEKNELRQIFAEPGFDVALTNPPFAKAYDRNTVEEIRILDAYEISRERNVARGSVRSALLFTERYFDLLKPGGKLVTIIDDGILSGDDYRWFRGKIREWFLVRAVVSLPGDAFQRSNARVKTSYLVLEKRDPLQEQDQPPVFMYPCRFVGNDDPKRQRARAGDAELRRQAEAEILDLVEQLRRFQAGQGNPEYIVPPERVADRLDVKNCLVSPGRQHAAWEQQGFQIYRLDQMLREREWSDEEVVTKESPDPVRVLVVRYEGFAEAGDEIMPADGSYAKLYPVYAGDIVISNIAASHGSIAVVPEDLDGCVVSSEYTVLQAREGFDPIVAQLILRSPEVRADILLSSSGANRTRARWDLIAGVAAPYPAAAVVNTVRDLAVRAEEAKRSAATLLKEARATVENDLALSTPQAENILLAFKPPK